MKRILFLSILSCLYFSCSEEDKEPESQKTEVDISVSTTQTRIFWEDIDELNQNIDNTFIFNFDDLSQNEIDKVIEINNDSTIVSATIDFKDGYKNSYIDTNILNNKTSVSLERISQEEENDNPDENEAPNYIFELINQSLINVYEDFDLDIYNFMEIPITFHIIRDDNGNGGLNPGKIPIELNELNQLFFEAKLSFYQCGDINYIDNSDFYYHTKGNEQYAEDNDVANTLNIYLPRRIEKTNGGTIGGYAFFPFEDIDRIYVKRGNFDGSTLEHEIGHYFSLYHTHSMLADLGVDGIGCYYDGDGICDTPFDPDLAGLISYPSCTYSEGDALPDNIMSYSSHRCRINFQPEQLLRMGYSARFHRNYLNCNSSTIQITGKLNFGDIEIGQAATQSFTINNTGSESFNITDIILPYEDYSLNWNSGSINPGGSQNVNVTFQPTNEQTYHGTIEVIHDANSGNGNITVAGNGVQGNSGNSIIELSGNLNFGNLEIGQSDTRTLTISNSGNESLNISSISLPYNVYSTNWNSGTISAGSSQNVNITFQPTNEQSYNGELVVNSNANSGDNDIFIAGAGIDGSSGNSVISLSGNLNFGNIDIGESPTEVLTIANTGTESFDVSSIILPFNVYSVNWNSGSINPGSSQTVVVTFQPNNEQAYEGIIEVLNNADTGNNIISVSGNGVNNTQNVILSYSDHLVKDGNGGGVGNSNGIAEAGEEIDLDVQLINIGNAAATNVSATLTTNDSDITITDDFEVWADIPAGTTEWEDDFDFDISENCPTKTVTFNIQITSDQGTWNDSFTINIQGSSGDPIPITPTDLCDNAPLLQMNTEYIVSINTADYGLAPPIDGQSDGGNNVRGFWLEFIQPSGYIGDIEIQVYDVSSNFDPVIGIKLSCNGIYYTQSNSSSFVANDNGYGGSETFTTYSGDNGYTERVRIYHYYGNETGNINFKIKLEEQ